MQKNEKMQGLRSVALDSFQKMVLRALYLAKFAHCTDPMNIYEVKRSQRHLLTAKKCYRCATGEILILNHLYSWGLYIRALYRACFPHLLVPFGLQKLGPPNDDLFKELSCYNILHSCYLFPPPMPLLKDHFFPWTPYFWLLPNWTLKIFSCV